MQEIDIDFRNSCTRQGEEMVHTHDGEFIPGRALTWPDTDNDASPLRSREPMVAKVDGIVAARAFFEAELYPFAELVNLYVSPSFRGKGVGDRFVGEMVKRACELGYLAIHVQTDLDNKVAQRLYAKHGFLPAQQGQRLRMVRFLNLPMLSGFLSTHPLVRFDSRVSDSDSNLWALEWVDLINRDKLTIFLAGGSCQSDSEGFAPGVARVEICTADCAFDANICGPDEVAIDQEIPLTLEIINNSKVELQGTARLLLNAGFAPGTDTRGVADFTVESDSTVMLALPALANESFDRNFWKYSSYGSVGIGIEVFVGSRSFWLVKQVKVTGRQ